jgi:GrpB-like predicted nucleotidyltransferase (UPF0157 family)
MSAPADRDPIAIWNGLRQTRGRRTTIIDLYRLVAEPRSLKPYELPRVERLNLARAAMPLVWPGFETTEGSERNDPIEVVEYNTDWPRRFQHWHELIAGSLGDVALRIEHVGSTSVPGLPAKPIIDVQVSITAISNESAYVPRLEKMVGVQLRSRDSMHRYFRPFAGRARDVHVHVCNAGSDWEREHLLFRDYVSVHGEDARRYAEAKREALRHWADDGWAYTDAKTDVILDILDSAESWAAKEGWAP